MVFSEGEIVAILKKALPKADYKDLGNIAQSILSEGEHWQEVDLNEHIHDEVETKMLHDICQRKSGNNRPPKNVRLFFKPA